MREQIHVRVEPATRLGLRALAAVGHVSAERRSPPECLTTPSATGSIADELARMVLANLRLAEQETTS